MSKETAVSDEQIIAALLNSGTLKAAAASAGLPERELQDRMSSGEFQALYKAAKADFVRTAVFDLSKRMTEAINTVAEIMEDENVNAAVRLQAAQTILNNAAKLMQQLQTDESNITMQVINNRLNSKRVKK